MLCRMSVKGTGEPCAQYFPLLNVGAYVQHLIRDHWDALVILRKAMEKGEL
jgi:hypothetical protein